MCMDGLCAEWRGGLHVVYLWHETTLGCVQGECERWGSTDPGLPESQGMRGCRQATEQVGFLRASLCLVWVSVKHFAFKHSASQGYSSGLMRRWVMLGVEPFEGLSSTGCVQSYTQYIP